MRISCLVGVVMVKPVGGNPDQWSTFQTQRGAYREKIFHPSRHLVAPVREQAMITHADSDIDGNDMKNHSDKQRGPGKEEERCDGSQMEKQHKSKDQPVHRRRLCIAREREYPEFRGSRHDRQLLIGRQEAGIAMNAVVFNREKGLGSIHNFNSTPVCAVHSS
jgi:hypothetical protein